MRDMRNVAAEKTMPLRLDPDPARACPAPIRKRAMHLQQPRPVKPVRREVAEQAIATAFLAGAAAFYIGEKIRTLA